MPIAPNAILQALQGNPAVQASQATQAGQIPQPGGIDIQQLLGRIASMQGQQQERAATPPPTMFPQPQQFQPTAQAANPIMNALAGGQRRQAPAYRMAF